MATEHAERRETALIRVLIVEDDPMTRESLARLVATDAEIEIVGKCADGKAAVEQIRQQRPDLVFLDVHMPHLDGFEALGQVPSEERPAVIFITAHEEHAVRAFEAGALDYLVKPFGGDRLALALKRGKDAVRRTQRTYLENQVVSLLEYVKALDLPAAPADKPAPADPDQTDRIIIKSDGALHFTAMSDVLWLEAQGDYVKVRTPEKTQLVRETLQSLEQKLDRTRFMRIHRSFVVNLSHVQRVETARYGDYSVFMSDGSKLRLSRSYRSKLEGLLGRMPRV